MRFIMLFSIGRLPGINVGLGINPLYFIVEYPTLRIKSRACGQGDFIVKVQAMQNYKYMKISK